MCVQLHVQLKATTLRPLRPLRTLRPGNDIKTLRDTRTTASTGNHWQRPASPQTLPGTPAQTEGSRCHMALPPPARSPVVLRAGAQGPVLVLVLVPVLVLVSWGPVAPPLWLRLLWLLLLVLVQALP